MSVSLSSLEYLWIEAVPLCREVSRDLGLIDNLEAETTHRVEKHGFNVGAGLAHVLTRHQTQFLGTELDVIKFVCKDLWTALFSKAVDTLKTNHRDTYVLIDHNFAMCQRMSTNLGPDRTVSLAIPYLWFPAGVVRGFLHGMGINAQVQFATTELPMVEFSITI